MVFQHRLYIRYILNIIDSRQLNILIIQIYIIKYYSLSIIKLLLSAISTESGRPENYLSILRYLFFVSVIKIAPNPVLKTKLSY